MTVINCWFLLSILIIVICFLTVVTVDSLTRARSSGMDGIRLKRPKRYVAFPDGSSVSGALCLTIGVIGNPHTDYLSYALNWGVAYDLPNETWVRQHAHGFKNDLQNSKPATMQRRSRRDLYEKIEAVISGMGFNGRACIARALCESSKYLQSSSSRRNRGNMIEEIVKIIFSFPDQHVYSHEPRAIHYYDQILRHSHRDVIDCSAKYAECHFSLLELALGKYSVPPVNEDKVWNRGGGEFGEFSNGFHQAHYFM